MGYLSGAEDVPVELIDLEAVLDVGGLVVGRYFGLLDEHQEVEGLVQQLFRLKLDLIVVQLLAEVPAARFVGGYEVD